jgi:hypothetical protein
MPIFAAQIQEKISNEIDLSAPPREPQQPPRC